jgi:hypothetical protein
MKKKKMLKEEKINSCSTLALLTTTREWARPLEILEAQ